jgi:hypothetical protein
MTAPAPFVNTYKYVFCTREPSPEGGGQPVKLAVKQEGIDTWLPCGCQSGCKPIGNRMLCLTRRRRQSNFILADSHASPSTALNRRKYHSDRIPPDRPGQDIRDIVESIRNSPCEITGGFSARQNEGKEKGLRHHGRSPKRIGIAETPTAFYVGASSQPSPYPGCPAAKRPAPG